MPKKILLADDSITIQKVVELTFSEGDYQVFSVGNGAQALRKIGEVHPDVALLDVIMPEANGYEVCEKVKRNPETSWIPVLLLTGTFEPFDRKRADAAGANGHLTKPFESQMLISKVEELIASSRHPVIQPESLGKMEIVEGGDIRSEVSQPSSAPWNEPEPESRELTGHQIVPDRFDDVGERAAPMDPEGIRTVRLPSDQIFPPTPPRPRDEPSTSSASEASTDTWDELASDLGSGPEPLREPPMRKDFTPRVADSPGPAFPEPEAPAPFPAPPMPTADSGAEFLPSAPPSSSAALSAADVDRVAARVVEQLSEKIIREIAWEVIPELAESLIRQRIRDLEEKISREN